MTSHFLALQIVGAIFEAGGLLAFAIAAEYRKKNVPSIPSEDPRHWKPVWLTRNRFIDERGYRLNMLGGILCGCGAIADVIGFLMD